MKTKVLTEVSLPIAAEAEEPLSAVCEGIFGQVPSIYVDADTGAVKATLYVEKWDTRLKHQFTAALEQLKAFGFDLDPKRVKASKLEPEDWAESWKKHFKPIEIGPLLVKPSWSKRRPKKNQHVVILDPGLSFGTGQHATTSFCLSQIVAVRKQGAKQSFLDIGTGSGILAIAAAKIGYSPVRAFDFDPESIRVSRENAETNDVASQVRPVRQDLTKVPHPSATQYDLVCANLIYDLLLQEAGKIVNRVASGGSLVLAGILQTQFAQVQRRFEACGMRLVTARTEKEWRSGRFVFRP